MHRNSEIFCDALLSDALPTGEQREALVREAGRLRARTIRQAVARSAVSLFAIFRPARPERPFLARECASLEIGR